ncbi:MULTISPECIES: metal-dependent transcriptional regulator [Nocardia]|uniref:Manganese transport regulator n=2 Tax=Nocardia farcinica TaxID=37329 RepID=Q5YSE1_NOCFA|nr:metal-dependent transcriptional regulator [Nocardia farcinica]PEH79905.1 metal-dependent transcriptional regulator [Nocardia sp. FDAARGOS_372]BAD58900.1 putative transcriptional regulator [Nocardia farcinica IFM 10152]MBF6070983.1 metal-dependent transcriptional regulator [Nocardia farcinica]MBF6185475.1 metal-dependent transcriptional regulator [Nocardia farcinica]MBF6230100.1 metal-dependent transcriptional regulator [Nocardia farcinica]
MHKLADVPGKRDVATRRELNDPAAGAAGDGPATAAPELTSVAQDYLKVIWTAQEWSQEKVSTKLLAERIGVSASTVSEAVRKLADQGLVEHARYGSIALTDHGRRAAVAMVRRHRLIETFLVNELGYGWDEVHDEAEVLEHAVSELLMARIDAKLGYPDRDPHGDPIPSVDGDVPTPPARQLSDFEAGQSGRVARISDSDPDMLRYFDAVGVALDTVIEVVERRDFAGTIAVRIGGSEGAVDLGRPAAEAIWLTH